MAYPGILDFSILIINFNYKQMMKRPALCYMPVNLIPTDAIPLASSTDQQLWLDSIFFLMSDCLVIKTNRKTNKMQKLCKKKNTRNRNKEFL